MAPTYMTSEFWRKEHPGVALILADCVGKKLIVKVDGELPPGRWRLLGILP